MKLNLLKPMLAAVTLSIMTTLPINAKAQPRIVLLDERQVIQQVSQLYPTFPGESDADRRFRITDMSIKAVQDYAKRHDVVVLSLSVYLGGDIENITQQVCNELHDQKAKSLQSQHTQEFSGR